MNRRRAPCRSGRDHRLRALANDTTAELKTGGLQYTRSEAVSMEEETLRISPEEVRVDYVVLQHLGQAGGDLCRLSDARDSWRA